MNALKEKIITILMCIDMLDSHPAHAIDILRMIYHISRAEVITK